LRPHAPERQLAVLPGGRGGLVLSGKVLVTVSCFWYLSNKVHFAPFTTMATTIDVAWAILALAIVMLQVPLAGLRWAEIVRVLAPAGKNTSRGPLLAITSISVFFAQLLPSMFGEAIRVRMLAKLGVDWPRGLASVLIDRGIGIIGIGALGFVAFLFSSPLMFPASYRVDTLLILGGIAVVGTGGMLLAEQIGAVLVLHRRTIWLGMFAVVAHEVLIRSHARVFVLLLALMGHGFSIIAIWALARAEGLPLPIGDAGALFTVIAGIAIIPISVGNWGLREVGVTAMLEFRGVPVDQALVFSVSIGGLFFLASIPGALLWMIYSPLENSEAVATC
jgi:glycosyltransferase 2 family protein